MARPLLLKVTTETETWVGGPETEEPFQTISFSIFSFYIILEFTSTYINLRFLQISLIQFSKGLVSILAGGQALHTLLFGRRMVKLNTWAARAGNSIFVDSLEVPYVSICFHLIFIWFSMYSEASLFSSTNDVSRIKLSPNHYADSTVERLASFWFRGAAFERIIRAACSSNVVSPFPFPYFSATLQILVSFVTSCIPRPHHFLWWLLEMHEYRSPSWWWWQRLSESAEEILTTRWCFEALGVRISQGWHHSRYLRSWWLALLCKLPLGSPPATVLPGSLLNILIFY